MKIIPAIDIIGGQCVRLTQGDYSKKIVYADNPVTVAKEFESVGIKHIHLVDLEGAKSSKIVNSDTLRNVSAQTDLTIDFGGGIKSTEAIFEAFKLGAKQVTIGSVAVTDKSLVTDWIKAFGNDKIILGADTKDGKVAINGWMEQSKSNIFEFLEAYVDIGIKHCICTDINKDGMLEGPSFKLYEQILSRFPSLKLIASGGVSSIDDLRKLKDLGVDGTIVGKAYYEEQISLDELSMVNQ